MALLKFIGIVILIYYFLKLVGRILFPYILNKSMEKIKSNMYEQFNQQKSAPEGEVTIQQEKANRRNSNFDGGEYIDYEEIKDK